MIKTARQLKDLIRNYMMERFLERISVSAYRDKFILKGSLQAVHFQLLLQKKTALLIINDNSSA